MTDVKDFNSVAVENVDPNLPTLVASPVKTPMRADKGLDLPTLVSTPVKNSPLKDRGLNRYFRAPSIKRKLFPDQTQLKSSRWKLTSVLGKGGFADTWRALDTVTDEEVAVKVIPLNIDGKNMEPFIKQEARMLQSVSNECGQNHVVCYRGMVNATLPNGKEALALVMSLAPGVTLRYAAVNSERDLRSLARQLLQALTYLHSVGIAHRDVKPDNVMVDGDGTLILVDLGIACQRCPEMYSGEVGTPGYIMPSLLTKMKDASGSSPVYIPKRDFFLGDIWAAAETLLTKAKEMPTTGPVAALLQQLKKEADAGDEAGVQSVVRELTR